MDEVLGRLQSILSSAPSNYVTWWLQLLRDSPVHVIVETALIICECTRAGCVDGGRAGRGVPATGCANLTDIHVLAAMIYVLVIKRSYDPAKR